MVACTDTVLLVDDNEIDLFINRKILEFNQFSKRIISTTSPMKALHMLSSETGDLPEIVFLDLNMPIMDGFKFLREFANLSEMVRTQVSIVILTSSENICDKELAVQSNAVVRYVSKPLTDEKVARLKGEISKARFIAKSALRSL